jgi:putative transcriptional regulator
MITVRPSDLLIAPPNLPDARFRKAVLMLTHSHEGGSFALCLNRPTRYDCMDILKDLDLDEDINMPLPLYWGGPVSPGTVWMLHSSEWSMQDHTVEINDEWSMTSNERMFLCLNDGDQPQQFRLMFGFCSWAPGQLQAELKGLPPRNPKHSWLVAQNPGAEWVFEQPVENLWENATTLSSHQAVDSWL